MKEVRQLVGAIPDGPVFGFMLVAWLLLFHFLGNSNLGNTKTPSLFHWMDWVYHVNEDDALGMFIPFVVLGLLWWKRSELRELKTRSWWPALLLVGFALALHFLGLSVQQNRFSIVGLYVGLWGFAGALWGPALLRATFFPVCLLVFCVPLGTVAETVTFPLRLFSTTITTFLSQHVLGIDVIQQGTHIFDASRKYSYEVAAACSGIRSITAVFVLTTIYGFLFFQPIWKRAAIVLLGIPLVIISNVLRLLMIILASEAISPDAGHYVHESTWISLLPYIVAFAGVLGAGRLLKEDRDFDLKEAMLPVVVAVAMFLVPRTLWGYLVNETPATAPAPPVFGAGSLVFVIAVSVIVLAAVIHDRTSILRVRRHGWSLGAVVIVLISGFFAFAQERQRSQKLSAPGVKVVPELMYAVSATNKVLAGTNAVYLPERVLAYESKPMPLSTVVYDWLPKDTTYGQRRYVASDNFIVDNMVVLMGSDRTSIHRPEFCITGQGFRILSETNGTIRMTEPTAYDLPVRRIHFAGDVLSTAGEKVRVHGVFVYWFVSDDQITADHRNRMLEAIRDFVQTGVIKRWAYVINMALCNPGGEEAAYERLQRFIRASVPEYQLTSGTPLSGQQARATLPE